MSATRDNKALLNLRRVLVFLNVRPLNQPEIMVPFARQNFDAEGNFVNEQARQMIAQMLQRLVAWSRRLAK